MLTPKFWQHKSIMAYILWPLSFIYCLIAWLKNRPNQHSHDCGVTVVCVGNNVAGGAGKTPTAIGIAKILIHQGKTVAFVSKGYGGTFTRTTQVNLTTHYAQDVGDEALLLAEIAPCFVCHRRVDGCNEAKKQGANVIILDDGMHDRSIQKDLTLWVIDGGFGFGNCFPLPAGPLRSTVEKAKKQANIALIIGEDTHNIRLHLNDDLPLLSATLTPETPLTDKSIAYTAFAGIGRPEKFFNSLTDLGYNLVNRKSFSDHHPYTKNDMNSLIETARKNNAQLITTTKDYVRIPLKYRDNILVFPIAIKWKNSEKIIQILEEL